MTWTQGGSRGSDAKQGFIAVTAVTILLLTGCAGPASPPTGSRTTATSTASASPTATPSEAPTAAPSEAPTAAPSEAPSGAPSEVPSEVFSATPVAPTPTAAGPVVCGPGELALALQSRPHDSGMSQFFWDLRLTNTGGTTCTVEGYPLTTLVDSATGEPVGSVSGTEPGRWYPVTVVALAPGTSAYSLLHLGQAGAYGCPPVPVDALDVTLPGWATSSRVATPNPIEGCDDDSTVIVRAGPLAPAPVTF